MLINVQIISKMVQNDATHVSPAAAEVSETSLGGSSENDASLLAEVKYQARQIVDRSIEVSEEGQRQLSKLVRQANEYRQSISNGPCGLKLLCFGACAATLVLVIMFEILPNLLSPFQLIVSLYAAIFAAVGIILESTTLPCKGLDLKRPLESWCRILSRVWGRGLFYLSVALFQFAQQSWVGWISGALLASAGLFSLIVSIYGSRQLNSTQKKLIAEYGNKGEASIRAAFEAFDKDKSGSLSKTELALATETLGSSFSADQLVGIFELLDTDNSGKIDFEEFKAWWTNQKDVNYSWV